jgi:hypothetical protein
MACEEILGRPVRLCSQALGGVAFGLGLCTFGLVPYFAGLFPGLDPDQNATVATPAPAAASWMSNTSPSAVPDVAGGGCGVSEGGGLSILGFILITRGLAGGALGLLLALSFTLPEEKLGFLKGNCGRGFGWLTCSLMLLGVGLAFYAPNLGGPQHMLAAVAYLATASLGLVVAMLMWLRRAMGDIGADSAYSAW